MPCSTAASAQTILPLEVFGPLDFRPFRRLASTLGIAPDYTESHRLNKGPKAIPVALHEFGSVVEVHKGALV